ncbi:MAG: hypothetical protein LBG15_09205 [Dysgonamonadaceae bacterium]|jgi:hypothetical protein|nr:hypothetical protein [Dysgonamonadaceae bacterium]
MKPVKFKTWIAAAGMIFLFTVAAEAASDFDKENGIRQHKFGDSFSRINNNEFQGGLRNDDGTFNPNDEEDAIEVGRRNGSVGDAIGLISGLGLIYGVYAGKRRRSTVVD